MKRTTKKSLAQDAREAMKAVVQIHAQGYSDDNIRSILEPRFAVPSEWTGSGFFVLLEGVEGYILTNAHVARNATSLQIMSPITSEEMFEVELVGLVKTEEPDIALLRMTPEEIERFKECSGGLFPYLELGDSSEAKRGMDIKAIGYPLGMDEPNISGGEISNFISGDDMVPERLVTDAAINPGNSGGPAIIEGGKVIGINTAIVVNANNIGFITPINFCKNLFEPLITWKYAKLTDLAGKLQKNSTPNANYLKQKEAKGVIVTHVVKNGMLDSAKIKPRDIITGINEYVFDRHGIVVEKMSLHKRNIYDIVRLIPIGSNVTFHVCRKGKEIKLETIAIPRPNMVVDFQPIVLDRKFIEFQGMTIQKVTYEIISAIYQVCDLNYISLSEEAGNTSPHLAITYIEQGSELDACGIDAGEVFDKIEGKEAPDLETFQKIIKNAQKKKKKNILFEMMSGSIAYIPLDSKASCEIIQFLKLHQKEAGYNNKEEAVETPTNG